MTHLKTQPNLDFWFEFASTYSYPAAMQIEERAKTAGVTVTYRPFLLGPIFKAQGWETSPFSLYPSKGRYMWRDLERLCADLDLPFRVPDPFPQPSLIAARIALVGLAQDWGKDFCRAIYRAEFADGRQIGDADVLTEILTKLRIDPQQTFDLAQSTEIKARLRLQTEEAQKLGIFGAPSFVTADGELFWGHDRMQQALAWAKRATPRV